MRGAHPTRRIAAARIATAGVCLVLALAPVSLRADPDPPRPQSQPQSQPDRSAAGGDVWQRFREQLGVEPRHLQVSRRRWRGGGRHTLPAFEETWADWQRFDAAASVLDDVTGSAVTFENLLMASADQAGLEVARPPGRGLEAAPPDGSPRQRLLDALLAIHADARDRLALAPLADLMRRVAVLPDDVARPLATVLEPVPQMLRDRASVFGGVPTREQVGPATRFGFGYRVNPISRHLNEHMDLARMITWAATVGAAVDRAVTQVDAVADWSGATFDWSTPLGRVAVGSTGNDRYHADDGPYLLLLEPDGHDHYAVGATSRDRDPQALSVLIDAAGNDTHDDERYGGFGSALLGLAFVRDLTGNDHWSAPYLGPAAAVAGVAVLIDDAGDDRYESRRLGQAAAVLGVAVLADRAGDDRYETFQMSQGFGGPQGVGILLDEAGNDHYTADDERIDFPSPQTREHNTSLSQGCGFGRRAHPGDGYSLAGGVGVLCDRAGDDTYFAGLFSQGAAYWYAQGLLHDRAGDDSYRGVWYSQGTAAHYASAALIDRAGTDRYHALMHQSQGAGHDFSNGLLRDDAGADRYRSDGGNVQGFGNANGVGVLWDRGADADRYSARGRRLGGVNAYSAGHPCVGLLLDEGGANAFPPNDRFAKPGTHWRRDTPANRPLALAAGWSR